MSLEGEVFETVKANHSRKLLYCEYSVVVKTSVFLASKWKTGTKGKAGLN